MGVTLILVKLEKNCLNHLLGVTNLVKFFSKKKIIKFIQIGSSAEYGNAISPQNEESFCSPQTPYALAKFSCTNFLLSIF